MKKANTININGKEYAMKKSLFCVNESPVHVSDYMSGKMSGIPSISTACTKNPICVKRMKDGESICSHCFAETTLKMRKSVREAMEKNYDLLTETVLDVNLLPKFANVRIVRIESFGDVANVTQAINYANIIKKNPKVMFAWWSKNMSIIKKAFDVVGKPKNVIMVESAPKMNTEINKSNEYVDITFTVYDHDNGAINCGSKQCLNCENCYKKSAKSVNELLK